LSVTSSTIVSLPGSLSPVLSTSVGVLPFSSCAVVISAKFVNDPGIEVPTVVVIFTEALLPAAIGPGIIIVAVLPAPAVQAASFKVKPAGIMLNQILLC